jgi:hypothetical protein
LLLFLHALFDDILIKKDEIVRRCKRGALVERGRLY